MERLKERLAVARRALGTPEQTTLGLEMIDDRNLTVHTYNESLAEEIYR